MTAQERSDLIESRAMMAKSVANTLLAAMQSDCPVVGSTVQEVIWSISELLSVTEIVAEY